MWPAIVTLSVFPFGAVFNSGSVMEILPSRLGKPLFLSIAALAFTENFLSSTATAMVTIWFSFNCAGLLLTKSDTLLVPISHQKLNPTSSVSGTPKTRKASLSEEFKVHSRSWAVTI